MELTRRQFIGKTATAVIVAGTMAAGKVFGANNRIRMCTVGFNGQGGSHIGDILKMKDDAEYVALWFKSAGAESGFYIYASALSAISFLAALTMRDTRVHSRILED